MDTHSLMTEQMIQNYLSGIDFKNGNFSVAQIKSDIQRIIGEVPAVKIKWNAQTKTNEMTGSSTRVESVESVTIGYTTGQDDDGKPNVRKIEIYV